MALRTSFCKTYPDIPIGYEACVKCYDTRFDTAMGRINVLKKSKFAVNLIRRMKQYTASELLFLDELGYIPIYHHGADCRRAMPGRSENPLHLAYVRRDYQGG